MPTDVPQASRARNPDKETVGVKWECPADIVLMLDAECSARASLTGAHVDRGPLLTEILGKWACEQAHSVMVKHNVLRGNSDLLESLIARRDRMSEVRALTASAIRLMARDAADAGEPCTHYWDAGSEEARLFEAAHAERARELEPVKAQA